MERWDGIQIRAEGTAQHFCLRENPEEALGMNQGTARVQDRGGETCLMAAEAALGEGECGKA